MGSSFVVLAIVGSGVALAATTPAAPSNTESFQISPPTSTYAANPGSTVTGTVKVTNLTGNGLVLSVGKENFVAKGEEGEIELTNNADPLYSLAPWFNLGTTPQISLDARATKSFSYSIAIPQNAEPGGRYGSITFQTIGTRLPNGQSGAAVVQQIAGIVFLRINGKANEKLSVASFEPGIVAKNGDFTNKSFFEYGPVNLLTRVENRGNVHEQPTGTITIKNMLGFTVATIPLDQHYVIPGAIRRLHNEWPSSGKHTFLFGRYSAHLSATYANNESITADTSFTVIPYRLLAVVLLVLIIIFVLFWRGRRRFSRAFRILAGRE